MSAKAYPIARFKLGRITTTASALAHLTQEDILMGIQRHQAGDWGDVDSSDELANERALIERTRLVSAYRAANGVKFCLVTEADRSATTILLPQDY